MSIFGGGRDNVLVWGIIGVRSLPQIDLVVSLDVPFSTIVDRIKGRWVHPGSGRVYNTDFQAPKVEVSTKSFIPKAGALLYSVH